MYVMYELHRNEPLYTSPGDEDSSEEQDGAESAGTTWGLPAV